jgi:hypothetical protein
VDSNDVPHIAYLNADGQTMDDAFGDLLGNLIYARRQQDGTWNRDTVDGRRTAGGAHDGQACAIAVDSNNVPHICYLQDNGTPHYKDLLYARRQQDGTWNRDTVDDSGIAGGSCAIAVGPDKVPHICYVSPIWYVHDLYAARKKADGTWDRDTVYAGLYEIAIPQSCTIAVGSNQIPHITYSNRTPVAHLRCARKQADGTWNHDYVNPGFGGGPAAIAMDDNTPHIAYQDTSYRKEKLLHAKFVEGTVGASGGSFVDASGPEQRESWWRRLFGR